MKKLNFIISLGLTASAAGFQVVDTTPANDQANLAAEAGQTFTTQALGADNKLTSIAVTTASNIGGNDPTGPFTLKLYVDTDGDALTWDPGALVATSTNSATLTPAGNSLVTFNFSGEELDDNTVYVVSFSTEEDDHVAFRAGLTNAAGVAIADGALFSNGAQPFGGAFDLSFIVTTSSVTEPNNLTWTASDGDLWNDSTTNWQLPDNSPSSFSNGDLVFFDDSAVSGNIIVSSGMQPGSMLFDHDTLDYTLSGEPISGLSSLIKQGTGSLSLLSSQNYLGGTQVIAGHLIAGDGDTSGEIGRGAVTIEEAATLTISRSDLLDYKASDRLRTLAGGGQLIIDGGGLLFTYPGGGLGFNSPGSWVDFTGDVIIVNDSEWQTIRNGATAHGSGTLTLGDATTSGNLSQVEGNWTWTNPIEVLGPNNKIINRSTNDFTRSLKLQGPISGSGNLTFEDATAAMTNPNEGFVITNEISLTGVLNIEFATPVRIGGVPGEVGISGAGLDAASAGSLGDTSVVNDGILTFSRTDSYTVDAPISGDGSVRIGLPSSANRGDTSTQVVTFATNDKTYFGDTIVESGTLLVNGELLDSFVDINPEGTLGGTGTIGLSTIVMGTIAPGDTLGTLHFDDDLIFDDNSVYRWRVSDFTGLAGTGYATLEAFDLRLEASAGQPTTILIEPVAIANFAETPATFTIASSDFPITFDPASVIVDPSAFIAATGSAGTWQVQLSDDELSLELAYTPGTPNDYNNWVSGFFPNDIDPQFLAFDADPDNDGIPNGIEYLFNSAPNAPGSGISALTPAPNGFTFTHPQSSDPLNDITFTYQWSSDLINWNQSGDIDTNGLSINFSTELIDESAAAGTDTIQVTAEIVAGVSTELFVRILATPNDD